MRPALVQAREERKAQREQAEHERRALWQINTDSQHQIFNDVNQDEHETTSASRQTKPSPSSAAEVMPESPDITEIDGREDGQARPVDHSPSSDPIPLPTVSEDIEVLEATTRAATEVYGARERPNQVSETAAIHDIPSTSVNTSEGSRIVHSNEDPEE